MTIDTITTDIDSIKKFIAGADEQPKPAEEGAKPEGEVEGEVEA
jgi:hypothetical protein